MLSVSSAYVKQSVEQTCRRASAGRSFAPYFSRVCREAERVHLCKSPILSIICPLENGMVSGERSLKHRPPRQFGRDVVSVIHFFVLLDRSRLISLLNPALHEKSRAWRHSKQDHANRRRLLGLSSASFDSLGMVAALGPLAAVHGCASRRAAWAPRCVLRDPRVLGQPSAIPAASAPRRRSAPPPEAKNSRAGRAFSAPGRCARSVGAGALLPYCLGACTWSNRASALHAASSASDSVKKLLGATGTSDARFDASVCVQCSQPALARARASSERRVRLTSRVFPPLRTVQHEHAVTKQEHKKKWPPSPAYYK